VFRLPEDFRDHKRIGIATVAGDGTPRLQASARIAELKSPSGEGSPEQLGKLTAHFRAKVTEAIAEAR
jgi:hypothetical protein